jgi:hypothetical protein
MILKWNKYSARVWRRALMNKVMNFRVPEMANIFLTSRVTVCLQESCSVEQVMKDGVPLHKEKLHNLFPYPNMINIIT